MHILENGPHGFGMGVKLNDEAISEWPVTVAAIHGSTSMDSHGSIE
jgi:hypothetical protein